MLIIVLLIVAILFSVASILLNLEIKNMNTNVKIASTTGKAITSGSAQGRIHIEIKPQGSLP